MTELFGALKCFKKSPSPLLKSGIALFRPAFEGFHSVKKCQMQTPPVLWSLTLSNWPRELLVEVAPCLPRLYAHEDEASFDRSCIQCFVSSLLWMKMDHRRIDGEVFWLTALEGACPGPMEIVIPRGYGQVAFAPCCAASIPLVTLHPPLQQVEALSEAQRQLEQMPHGTVQCSASSSGRAGVMVIIVQPLLTEACPTTSPADNCTAHSSLGLTTARKSMPNSWSSWNVRCKTTRMTTLHYAREGQANGPEQEQPCPSHHCAPQSPRLSRKSR